MLDSKQDLIGRFEVFGDTASLADRLYAIAHDDSIEDRPKPNTT